MKKKKILIIVTPLLNKGGTIKRLILWSRYLQPHFEIKVICWAAHENIIKIFEEKGTKILHEKKLNKLGRIFILPSVFAIYKEIKLFSPDVIISCRLLWAEFLTSWVTFLRNILGKKPIPRIVHIGGNRVPPSKQMIFRTIYKILTTLSSNPPEKVVTICHHDAHMISSEYVIKNKKIVVIPIGIELFPFREKKKLHTPFVFGVVSRLVPVKNVESIIRVFHNVITETNKAARLEIFGDGICRKELETLVSKLGLKDNNIVFKGWVEDFRLAFDCIDCLLSFSHDEGTPRSILEAGEMGVPTIARNVGGVGELIIDSKTGYIVRSEQELKEKIIYVLHANEEKILNMGLAARRFMQEHHSIENEIHKLKNLVEELLSGEE